MASAGLMAEYGIDLAAEEDAAEGPEAAVVLGEVTIDVMAWCALHAVDAVADWLGAVEEWAKSGAVGPPPCPVAGAVAGLAKQRQSLSWSYGPPCGIPLLRSAATSCCVASSRPTETSGRPISAVGGRCSLAVACSLVEAVTVRVRRPGASGDPGHMRRAECSDRPPASERCFERRYRVPSRRYAGDTRAASRWHSVKLTGLPAGLRFGARWGRRPPWFPPGPLGSSWVGDREHRASIRPRAIQA